MATERRGVKGDFEVSTKLEREKERERKKRKRGGTERGR